MTKWENARTLGRRDVPFWRRVASEANGLVLELGCGTGRVSIPLARAGTHLVLLCDRDLAAARPAARISRSSNRSGRIRDVARRCSNSDTLNGGDAAQRNIDSS